MKKSQSNFPAKKLLVISVVFMVIFILLKIAISFFTKGGYQPMLEDLFLNGHWKKTTLGVMIGGAVYSIFIYFSEKRKTKK